MIYSLRFIFTIFLIAYHVFPIFAEKNYHPNSLMLDSLVCVVDTIEARKVFDSMRPSFFKQISDLEEKARHCNDILNSKKKKVSSQDELLLLSEAYNHFRNTYPEFRKYKTQSTYSSSLGKGITGSTGLPGLSLLPILSSAIINQNRNSNEGLKGEEIFDKNVVKGKLTQDVKRYLNTYMRHLTDKKENLKSLLSESPYNFDWLEYVENPPTKLITIQIENPHYRGLHYDDEYTLDIIDKSIMIEGIEFLFSKEGRYESESYPIEISYLKYPQIPNYRITYNKDKNNKIGEVYDEKGNLVLIPYLDRDNYYIFKEFKRLVYFDDYKNNKYNIKSEKQDTHKCLNLWIGRKNGFEESQSDLASMQMALNLSAMFGSLSNSGATKTLNKISDYRDVTGEKFINQLEKDHANEFGYIYSIERMGDKQFRVIYLNKETLKPSICGIVTFENGKEPYTSTYSVMLCDLPHEIPPAIRH